MFENVYYQLIIIVETAKILKNSYFILKVF